jgi:glycosyltransferase involved in cell wall biosynthesis
MRIALFSWESLHSIQVGGVAVVVTELAASLSRKGHEVHVFTRFGHGQGHYDFINGVHYHRCPFNLNPNFVDEVNDMCRSMVYHFFETQKFSGWFDVIHAHDWLTSNAVCWIKQAEPYKKAVLTIHSTEYGRCGNNFCGGQSARIRDHERHGTYCADRVLVVSHALKGEIMWMYNVPDWKVKVVYNGINYRPYNCWINPGPIKSSYGIGPLDPTILFVGRMVYQKGPDLLVESIPMILHYYPHAKFIFVGDGEMFGYVADKARHFRVDHATRFLRSRNGVELINLYKLSDVVCVPSRNEPFGLVILEAWSAGKPVVATNSGGPGEFIWHEVNGLKTYVYPESIAWGIGNLLKDFEHARWMGRNGRIAVETAFSWDHIGDDVLGVYSS